MEKAKFCVDCKFFEEDPVNAKYICGAPVSMSYDMVLGLRSRKVGCDIMRGAAYLCGETAQWFELKEKPEKNGCAAACDLSRYGATASPTGKVQVIAGRGDREVKR